MVDKLPTPEDKGDLKLLEDVEANGWHVVKIMPNEDTPGWAFTVGLTHNFDHPEVVVFGLPLDIMHSILNEIGGLIRGGARFEPGATSSEVLDGYDCQFQAVDNAWLGPFLGYAVVVSKRRALLCPPVPLAGQRGQDAGRSRLR